MSLESNLIDFNQNGGYRLEQPTLKKLQATTYFFIKAMIGHFGIADVGNFIISGCEIVGPNITAGILYIDGVLCPFEETAGTLATKIKKNITVESIEFFNGTTPNVFQKFTAIVDASGTALSAFVRVPSPFNLPAGIVIDNNYLAFTQAMLDKLNDIEANAEKNVQADWNETNVLLDSYIKNKFQTVEVLVQSSSIVGDIFDNTSYQVVFPNPIGTANYQAILSFESTSEVNAAVGATASVFYAIHDKTVNGFKIRFREAGGFAQNLKVEYLIVKK